jgi:hypothetical protein
MDMSTGIVDPYFEVVNVAYNMVLLTSCKQLLFPSDVITLEYKLPPAEMSLQIDVDAKENTNFDCPPSTSSGVGATPHLNGEALHVVYVVSRVVLEIPTPCAFPRGRRATTGTTYVFRA